jgi:hypothetical protein
MRPQTRICDNCRLARAMVETEAGFFFCDDCEAVIDVEFFEFEIAPQVETSVQHFGWH